MFKVWMFIHVWIYIEKVYKKLWLIQNITGNTFYKKIVDLIMFNFKVNPCRRMIGTMEHKNNTPNKHVRKYQNWNEKNEIWNTY